MRARRFGPAFALVAIVALGACSAQPGSGGQHHAYISRLEDYDPWVEHFEWLNPLFNERLEPRDGRMIVPNRPGLGFTLSEQAHAWTTDTVEFGTN